jgi:hypothetical protein
MTLNIIHITGINGEASANLAQKFAKHKEFEVILTKEVDDEFLNKELNKNKAIDHDGGTVKMFDRIDKLINKYFLDKVKKLEKKVLILIGYTLDINAVLRALVGADIQFKVRGYFMMVDSVVTYRQTNLRYLDIFEQNLPAMRAMFKACKTPSDCIKASIRLGSIYDLKGGFPLGFQAADDLGIDSLHTASGSNYAIKTPEDIYKDVVKHHSSSK